MCCAFLTTVSSVPFLHLSALCLNIHYSFLQHLHSSKPAPFDALEYRTFLLELVNGGGQKVSTSRNDRKGNINTVLTVATRNLCLFICGYDCLFFELSSISFGSANFV